MSQHKPLLSKTQRAARVTLCLFVVWFAGGATCWRRKPLTDFEPPPEIFKDTPTREELAAAINRTGNIQKLQSTSATVKVPSMPVLPQLNATLALERPRRLSLRGSLPIVIGDAFNLGSNEELFWFKVPEGMSKSLYFAKHEEYQRGLARSPFPIYPAWLLDAIGLPSVDVGLIREGPNVRADGKLELKLAQPMPDGVYTRVLAVDAARGVVTEQFLYSPDGRLLANASGDDFRYFAEAQCSLPHDIQIQLTPAGLEPTTLKLEVGSYVVNQLLSEDPRQFALPQDGNERIIDLAKLGPAGLTVPAMGAPAAGNLGPPQAPSQQFTLPPAGPASGATVPAIKPAPNAAANYRTTPGYQPPVGYVPETRQATSYRGAYRIR